MHYAVFDKNGKSKFHSCYNSDAKISLPVDTKYVYMLRLKLAVIESMPDIS